MGTFVEIGLLTKDNKRIATEYAEDLTPGSSVIEFHPTEFGEIKYIEITDGQKFRTFPFDDGGVIIATKSNIVRITFYWHMDSHVL